MIFVIYVMLLCQINMIKIDILNLEWPENKRDSFVIAPIRIYPGSPWENGYNERFNGTLRREILDAEWFVTTKQAQTAINIWLKQYNHIRPHQALNMRPPVPQTLLKNGT